MPFYDCPFLIILYSFSIIFLLDIHRHTHTHTRLYLFHKYVYAIWIFLCTATSTTFFHHHPPISWVLATPLHMQQRCKCVTVARRGKKPKIYMNYLLHAMCMLPPTTTATRQKVGVGVWHFDKNRQTDYTNTNVFVGGVAQTPQFCTFPHIA